MNELSPRCRIGFIQLATLPAYASRSVDWLNEPAPPTLTSLDPYLSKIRSKTGVQALMSAISDAHLSDLIAKLRQVLGAARELRCDILVFPEYSIPARVLPQLYRAAKEGNCTIVAGSHVVLTTPENLRAYGQSGLTAIQEHPDDYSRCAMAPIFMPSGESTFRLKNVPSKWETDLSLVDAPQTLVELAVRGQSIRLQVLICIEALTLGAILPTANLLAICACSPQVEPFENLFAQAILNEVPAVISNSALYGGSQFSLAGAMVPGDLAALVNSPDPDELLTVVELQLERQVQKRRSAKAISSWALLGRKPFLYREVAEQAQLLDLIAAARNYSAKELRTLNIGRHLSSSVIPHSMRRQLELFQSAQQNGVVRQSDGQLLLDAVMIPEGVLPFWNRCQQALEESNSHIATLIPIYPGDPEIARSVVSLSGGMQHARRGTFPLTVNPPPLRDSSPRAIPPFRNREADISRLHGILSRQPAVLLYGLPGIGKRTVVDQVVSELYPRHHRSVLVCVDGMTPGGLIDELSSALGHTRDELRRMSEPERQRLSHVVVVRDLDHIDLESHGSAQLADFFSTLTGSAIKVFCFASRKIESGLPSLWIGPLEPDDTRRIFEFYCRLFGVKPHGEDIVPHLWGYPLAARTAATLLRDGAGEAFARLRFLRELRSEVVKVLLGGLTLTAPEKKALEALSVFRRPVEMEVIEQLPITGLQAVVEKLEERFLISREDDKVFVMPLIREVAISEWIKPGAASAFHRVAATFYRLQTKNPDSVRRFEAVEEAIYHFSSLGEFQDARSLGSDWLERARFASRDLYKRGGVKESLVICEKGLESKPTDREFLTRAALCCAKLKLWARGEKFVDRLGETGEIPALVLTGLGDALVRIGSPQEGKAYFQRCLELHPQDSYAAAAMADVELKEGKLSVARNLVDEALEWNSKNTRALEVSSTIARAEGNPERAYRDAYTLMTIDPRRWEQTFNKARSALKRKCNGVIPPQVLEELEGRSREPR